MFSCFKCFLVLTILQVCRTVHIPPEKRVPCAQKRFIIVQKICDFCLRAHRPPPHSSSSSSSSSSSISSISSIEDESVPMPIPLSFSPSALPGLPVYPGTYPVPPGGVVGAVPPGGVAGAVPPVPPQYPHLVYPQVPPSHQYSYPPGPLPCPPCAPIPSSPVQTPQKL